MLKKGLALAVILLLMGISFAPSIAAYMEAISDNKEPVEIRVDIWGFDTVDTHKALLTREQADRLDVLFDEIRLRLDNSEDTSAVFNDAVELLDDLGLLGDLSVEEAQKLVIADHHNLKIGTIFEKIYYKNKFFLDINENWDCEICGEISNTRVWGRFTNFESFLWNSLGSLTSWLFDFDRDKIYNLFKFDIKATIGIGYFNSDEGYHPSRGWLWSSGQNGEVSWNNTSMYGNIRKRGFGDMLYWGCWYVGITDFRGTVIQKGLSGYYLGYAQHAKIGETPLP